MEVTKKFLQKKLSPLEDKEFTAIVRSKMVEHDFTRCRRKFRGAEYIVLYPTELWGILFHTNPHKRDLMNIGRSLQALYWERSSLSGDLIFVKEIGEYLEFGY